MSFRLQFYFHICDMSQEGGPSVRERAAPRGAWSTLYFLWLYFLGREAAALLADAELPEHALQHLVDVDGADDVL